MGDQNADTVAARLAEIRQVLDAESDTGRWHWDHFSCDDMAFVLSLLDDEN